MMNAVTNEPIHCHPMEQFEPKARALLDVHPTDDGTDDDNLASSILSSAPRLSTKYNSFSTSPLRSDELWAMRKVDNGDEQLYAKGKSVYWTRNSMIIKSFNFTDQVVRVFWTRFKQQEHVCIALVSGLSVFDQVGRHFQILLPFAYSEMFATNLGLIIERNCSDAEDPSLPVHFALTHPTREISPVIFKPMTRTNSQYERSSLTYSLPICMSIVACHESLPYSLVYNSHDMQHSVWKLRHTTAQEDEEFMHTHANEEQSTANTFSHNHSACSYKTEGISHGSLSLSSRQKSNLLQQSHHSSTATTMALNNFSPRIDFKNRHSTLGNLAASRLGAGCGQLTTADINFNSNMTNIKSFNSAHTFNTISTPNRNRMINYLRDNIEEPILPELVLEQIWTESSSNSSKATKFFTMIDLAGDEYAVLVMSASSQIKVIKRDKIDKTPDCWAFGRNSIVGGIDAAAIESMGMMLVLDTTRNFVLYSGFDRVAAICVGLPQYPSSSNLRVQPGSSPASMKAPFDMSPIHASSARKRSSMAERSSVGSEISFQQMFHTLSPVPHAGKHESKTSSPICSSDIGKIKFVIGNSVIVSSGTDNNAKFEVPPVCQTSYVNRILKAIKAIVSKDLGLTIISRWYRTRRAPIQPDLMGAKEELNLFKRWFIRLLGVEKNLFESDDTSKYPIDSHPSPVKISRRSKELDSNPILANVNSLFYAMHLVFEDLSVIKLNKDIVASLAEFLLILSCLLKFPDYQQYYYTKFPQLEERYRQREQELSNLIPKLETLYKPAFIQSTPPSVDDFIGIVSNISAHWNSLDSSEVELLPYPNIKGVTENSFSVVSLFCEAFSISQQLALKDLSSTATKPTPFTPEKQPQRSREADQKVVEQMVKLGKDLNYLSVLHESVSSYFRDAVMNSRESPPSNWCESCYNLIGRVDLVDLVSGRGTDLGPRAKPELGDDETLRLLFQDLRVPEAIRMVSSDTPIEFSVMQRRGATEEESREEILRNLYLVNVRTMAMPVGRGAISLRTYSPVIGESFEIPKLELSGKNLSEDRLIEYTHDTSVYPWPYFHNGVAAGLSICAPSSNNIIDSTWINYNRPRSNIPAGADQRDRESVVKNIDNEHAGFLLALGLNGHLEKLSLMAIHDYLCQNNDLTKLSILLGMSAAKRGTRDVNIIKVLSIHVDALLPPNSTELDVSAPVHAASIIGVGLLYQGSGDSHISRILLEEIGRLPGPEANSHIDRESYSLSAGLAFGMVNLCNGGAATITSSDQLRLYMLGGKRKPLTIAQKERYFKQDCHRGEEAYINTHITSPGGTLGLGLMYHRSGNKSVANWMRAPDTQTLLEYVRPDFLLLRMISYGLIMWDEVTPDEEYINSHMPNIVRTHTFEQTSLAPGSGAPLCTDTSIDHELISQAGCNIVAGCCMAIALKYAGTADRGAYNTIYAQTKLLLTMSNSAKLAEQAGRPCIEACLNVLVTALAVVMAGTGDLGVNRICRYLRSRLTQSCVFYGSYMAVHLSLGILFLGACRYSLSSSPESIAALVCALYPIYPNHSSDNRYHLQALRHLYVLAAEPRLLIPRNIQTNQPVYVDITVKQRQGEGKVVDLQLRAPCLLPEMDTIEKVCINDERYWRIEIESKRALIKCLLQEHGFLSVNPKIDPSRPSRRALHKQVLQQL